MVPEGSCREIAWICQKENDHLKPHYVHFGQTYKDNAVISSCGEHVGKPFIVT